MEISILKRLVLILLAAAMLVQGKSVDTTVLTCHSSGKQSVSVGDFDACCLADAPSAVNSLQARCCDFAQQTQIFSPSSQVVDGFKIAAQVLILLDSSYHYANIFRVALQPELLCFAHAPPLWRPDILKLICKISI